MAIRPPKYNSQQGYTLLEMLAVISIVGIVIGFAAPSLLALNKPLRDGTSQFKTTLALIRSKAISSNQAYRIRPKYPTKAEYRGEKYQQTPHNFIVEYAANCQVNKYGSATAGSGLPDGWLQASQFDLDLPEAIGIDGTVTVNGTATSNGSESFTPANGGSAVNVTYEANLRWSICYDNRGIAYQPVTLTFKDFQGNNRAKTSTIQLTGIGQIDIDTKDNAGTSIPKSNGNPVF